MGMFNAFDITASGMTAQRYRMDIIAENVANAYTTRTTNGGTYKRKIVTFEAKGPDGKPSFASMLTASTSKMSQQIGSGVRITSIQRDNSTDVRKVYDPSHPDADDSGYVYYPNVDMVTEMTNLIDATRAYEANATALNASKGMIQRALSIGQE